jgi:hypothetical protein
MFLLLMRAMPGADGGVWDRGGQAGPQRHQAGARQDYVQHSSIIICYLVPYRYLLTYSHLPTRTANG